MWWGWSAPCLFPQGDAAKFSVGCFHRGSSLLAPRSRRPSTCPGWRRGSTSLPSASPSLAGAAAPQLHRGVTALPALLHSLNLHYLGPVASVYPSMLYFLNNHSRLCNYSFPNALLLAVSMKSLTLVVPIPGIHLLNFFSELKGCFVLRQK